MKLEWMLMCIIAPVTFSTGVLLVVFGIWGLDRGAGDSWTLLILGAGTLVAGAAVAYLGFDRIRQRRKE
jgi:hypothetical protein